MAKQKQAKVVVPLQVGDRVKIKNYGGKIGRIADLRGPLGPGGAPVYRVLVQKKPTASYIELLGHQLESVPATEQVVRAPKHKDNSRAKKGGLKLPS